jgi:hypothetical protein
LYLFFAFFFEACYCQVIYIQNFLVDRPLRFSVITTCKLKWNVETGLVYSPLCRLSAPIRDVNQPDSASWKDKYMGLNPLNFHFPYFLLTSRLVSVSPSVVSVSPSLVSVSPSLVSFSPSLSHSFSFSFFFEFIGRSVQSAIIWLFIRVHGYIEI